MFELASFNGEVVQRSAGVCYVSAVISAAAVVSIITEFIRDVLTPAGTSVILSRLLCICRLSFAGAVRLQPTEICSSTTAESRSESYRLCCDWANV